MKTTPLLLLVSLALNVVCFVVWRTTKMVPSNPTASSLNANTAGVTVPSKITASIAAKRVLWTNDSHNDLDALSARLRAAGCPPRELAIILQATIRQRGEGLLFDVFANRPYWSSGRPSPVDVERRTAFFREVIEQEKRAKKYLMTPELFAANEEVLEFYRNGYGDFPVEKLRRFALLEAEQLAKSIERRLAQRAAAKAGETRDEDPAVEKREEEEALATIKGFLTPAEFELYELRNSSLAKNLRSRLEAFRPTEQEYKTIYALEQSMQQKAAGRTLTPRNAAHCGVKRTPRLPRSWAPSVARTINSSPIPAAANCTGSWFAWICRSRPLAC